MKGAFAFVTCSLFGSMILRRFSSHKDGIVKGFLSSAPYLVTAIICKLLIANVFTGLALYGTAVSVGVTVLVAYIMFKAKQKKAA